MNKTAFYLFEIKVRDGINDLRGIKVVFFIVSKLIVHIKSPCIDFLVLREGETMSASSSKRYNVGKNEFWMVDILRVFFIEVFTAYVKIGLISEKIGSILGAFD